MTEFACKPSDFERLPWMSGCQQCTNLHMDGEPGLFTWVCAVARHFEDAHQIVLVGAHHQPRQGHTQPPQHEKQPNQLGPRRRGNPRSPGAGPAAGRRSVGEWRSCTRGCQRITVDT